MGPDGVGSLSVAVCTARILQSEVKYKVVAELTRYTNRRAFR